MMTAKLFRHGGSQAVRLPKAFRLPGTEVLVEKRGEEIVLRAKTRPKLKSLADVARYMAEHRPTASNFPDRAQPSVQQERNLRW